ncbi:MAG: DUF1583 domain-containing protein [Planctomycetaceae bacterium]
MLNRLIVVSLCLLHSSPEFVSTAVYTWDFRNGHFDNLSLVPIGPGAVNLLQPTNEGLRVSVPAGHDVKSVGFSPRFMISGDFELTVDFTILNRTQPKSGFGTGPNIYLSMGSTSDAAASLSRLLRPDCRDVYGVFAARIENGERIPAAKLFDVPRADKSQTGRMQLKRAKSEISYSIADDDRSPLRLLVALPVSDADVTMLRIGLSQSDIQSAATIVLHKISIEADDLPHLPSEQSRTAQLHRPQYQPPSPPKSYRWLWQSLAALIVTSGTVMWWWKRRY